MRYQRLLMMFILLSGQLLFPLLGYGQRPDELLWYREPAAKWTDALPLGNGRLGAMVFGGVAKERIQFNEESLWTGAPRQHDNNGAADYLAEIRRLLAANQQAAAEKLADAQFMGLQSPAGNQKQWIADMRAGKGLKGNPAAWDYDDQNWSVIEVPAYEGWETVGLEGLDGAVWFRTTFTLPKDFDKRDYVLDLNKIRDQDFTYVNGVFVGSTAEFTARRYTIPGKLLKPGKNVLAIQVLNFSGKGGIAGYKDTSQHLSVYPVPLARKEKDKNSGRNSARILADEPKPIILDGKWRYKIQNSNPPAVPHFQADYQPFGDLMFDFKYEDGKSAILSANAASNYRRELDLITAVSKTTYTIGGVDYSREYFVSQPDQVIVVHLTASKPGKLSFMASLSTPHQQHSFRQIDSQTISMHLGVKDGALLGESFLKVVVEKGKLMVTDSVLSVGNADEVTFYLSGATNFINYKNVSGNPYLHCKKTLAAINGKSYQKIKSDHLKEYQQHYQTFSVQIEPPKSDDSQGSCIDPSLRPTDIRLAQFKKGGDPSFASLYMQYGRYLLISSSRPGTKPANLQGIWNDLLAPPWGSKYTTNINAEMNYWPAEVLNLSPMHQPMFDMIDDLSVTGAKTAKTYYRAQGWVVHHNTDIWRATAPINSATHGIWVTGAAWLTMDLWEHFLFTQDKEFLQKRAYPLMKSAAEFFLDFMVRDPKSGWLISAPSNSPENGGLVAGPTMDHQLIRTLFKNCVQAAKILETDSAFSRVLTEKYKQIAPNQIGQYGQLQEWLEDKDDTTNKHRHVSHLWGVYPGDDITWDKQPELMKAARQSLIYRGDEGTGWSLAWKINFWARFKEGDHAMKMVKMLLSPVEKTGGSYANLFDAHPPFQIDGNFGAVAGLAEMLLQSHTQFIDLLPALPDDFVNGKVQGICARGGFVLTITWSDHVLQQVAVTSKAGADCALRYGDKVAKFSTTAGKTYVFDQSLTRKL